MQTKQTLEEMLNEGHHSDVTFETQIDDRTPAHRCVLAAVSPVFRAMFSTPVIEETTKIVSINDMTSNGLRAFLQILYTGSLDGYDVQGFGRELLAASHKYQTPEVTKIVRAALFDTITVDNCAIMFEHGSLYDETLLSWCKTFIVKNWKLVVCTSEFADLAMRKLSLQLDLVKSIALDKHTQELRELKVSFGGCTTILRMDPNSTVSHLISDLRTQICQPTMCLQIVGVVDHRIDLIYEDCDTVGDLPVQLKAEEICPKSELVLRVSHMLTFPDGKFCKYFGEPFSIRAPSRHINWTNLISRFSDLLDLPRTRLALRSFDDPHDTAIQYLPQTSGNQTHVQEDEFLAIVHPSCLCSSLDIHSHVDHLYRDVAFCLKNVNLGYQIPV